MAWEPLQSWTRVRYNMLYWIGRFSAIQRKLLDNYKADNVLRCPVFPRPLVISTMYVL